MWDKVVAKAFEGLDVELEVSSRGFIKLVPLDDSRLEMYILQRRIPMSIDRKVEVTGVIEVSSKPLQLQSSEVFKAMLESSVEINLKGLIRKKVEVKKWGELDKFSGIFRSLSYRGLLEEKLKRDREIIMHVKRLAPMMIEIYPGLVPRRYFETLLLSSSREMGSLLSSIIKSHAENPDRLEWNVKTYLMYGLPGQAKKIRESYFFTRKILGVLDNIMPELLY